MRSYCDHLRLDYVLCVTEMILSEIERPIRVRSSSFATVHSETIYYAAQNIETFKSPEGLKNFIPTYQFQKRSPLFKTLDCHLPLRNTGSRYTVHI